MRNYLSIAATADKKNIRTAQLMSQEFTVVPCIALVEGVLHPSNAPAPELALASEFGKFPESWNGRPVVLNHPTIDGIPVSASHPSVLESYQIGQIFNTVLDDKKLTTELWLNNARIKELGGEFLETLERFTDGDEVVEVSTGLFTVQNEQSGTYGDQDYSAVWTNCVPDHLAVLSKGVIGACSVKDGCGAPRVNAMEASRMEPTSNCACEGAPKDNEAEAEAGAKLKEGFFQRLMNSALKATFGFKSSSDASNVSDQDVRTAVSMALSEVYADGPTYVIAVFHGTDDSGRVVFEKGWNFELYSQEFSINDNVIALTGEPTKVRPHTQFIPVEIAGDSEGKDVTANAVVEKPKELEQSQSQLTPVIAQENHTVDLETYLKEAPVEIRQVLTASMYVYTAKKNELITNIMANTRNKFTKEQLEVMELPMLEALGALAVDATYVAGAALTTNASSAEETFMPAPNIFQTQAA